MRHEHIQDAYTGGFQHVLRGRVRVADSSDCPTAVGILAGHCDIISAVVPGKMTYRVPGGENQIAAVSGGLVKVEDGEVLVLVDSAERPEEIDANRAREAAAAAKEAMLQKRSIREFHAAQMTLARATVRLKVKSVNQQP